MDIKKLAELITEDPDVVNEIRVRCKRCGVVNDTDNGPYCRACAYTLTVPKIKAPISKCSVDDVDWNQFKQNLEQYGERLSMDDLRDSRSDHLFAVYAPSNKSTMECDAAFLKEFKEKVMQICKEISYWELEETTEPRGYHGRFIVYRALINLNLVAPQDITVHDPELGEDNRLEFAVEINAPCQYRRFEDSYA